MQKMRAVIQKEYGGPEVLKVEHMEVPQPKSNEILVRVYAAPVTTAGSFMREGVPYIGRLAIGLFRPKAQTPGVGFSGVVARVGEDVKEYKVGDAVFGETLFQQGTQAEYICIPEDDVITHKPPGVPHLDAATACDGHLTSLNFLTRVGKLKAGDRLLIIGASGSLGSAAIQIGKQLGAHVTAVSSTPHLDSIRSLGADAVINRLEEDYTKGHTSYDIIYDTVGKSRYRKCSKILSDRGTYMSPVLNSSLLLQSLWTSIFPGKRALFAATGLLPKEVLREMLQVVAEMMSLGQLHTLVDRTFLLSKAVEAHAYVDSEQKMGNVVLQMVA